MASTASYPLTPSISMLHDRIDTGTERRRNKRPPNSGSQLLDNQENQLLFSLLGSDNVSLYAGVVELLFAENRQWKKFARGVISLVKDYQNRAYFLRLYDFKEAQELVWEIRLYKNFQSFMSDKCNRLLTFEGEYDGQVYGLNFSSADEARSFKGHLDKRYEQERKTRTLVVFSLHLALILHMSLCECALSGRSEWSPPMSTTQSSSRADQLYIPSQIGPGTTTRRQEMWLTVSEDPHGRIRYHQDLYPRGGGTLRAPSSRYSSSVYPEQIYSTYRTPTITRGTVTRGNPSDFEREEYDNVNPDSPIPQYYSVYNGYSCSPGTSSSSTYEEDYGIPVRTSQSQPNFHQIGRYSHDSHRNPRNFSRDSRFPENFRDTYRSRADLEAQRIYSGSHYSSNYSSAYPEYPEFYDSSFSHYSTFGTSSRRRPPLVPSPDYSPPPPVNRVRFVDEEIYRGTQSEVYGTYQRSSASTSSQQQSSIPSIDPRGRSADSAKKKATAGDYQRRLQTSASDADLSRYAKGRGGSASAGINLKQARRFLKERLFSTVAGREPRPAPPPASSVFSPSPEKFSQPTPFTNGITAVGTISHTTEKTPVSSTSSFFGRKKKDKKKPRIRKEDISNPTNFQHKAHVGWDQDSGFSNNVDSDPMDQSIKDIIRAAGQDPNNLSKKTIKFVYDFIERYEENTNTETSAAPAQFSRHQAPPPPVPAPISQWSAPPPPPPSRGASYQSSAPPSRPPPPPPSSGKFNTRPLPQVPSTPEAARPAAIPPPPPPMPPSVAPIGGGGSVPPAPPPPPPSFASSAPAPPPPPPSGLSTLPAPQSGRSDLLAQIQAGKQLRSVGPSEKTEKKTTGGADARDDVMAQIRLGANLRHVDHSAEQEKRKSVPAVADMGGIAGALAKALEERRMNMCIDDSSDEDESDEKNEWSD